MSEQGLTSERASALAQVRLRAVREFSKDAAARVAEVMKSAQVTR